MAIPRHLQSLKAVELNGSLIVSIFFLKGLFDRQQINQKQKLALNISFGKVGQPPSTTWNIPGLANPKAPGVWRLGSNFCPRGRPKFCFFVF